MSDDVLHLRASSFGSCIKNQVALALGMSELPPNAAVQGWYDRGNAHEDACETAMEADGWDFDAALDMIRDDGQVFVALEGEGWQLTGHLDGVAAHQLARDARMIEIKAPSTYARFEKAYKTRDFTDPYMNQIAHQVSVYMVATGLECVMASWTEEEGLKTFGIEVPVYDRDMIDARAREIWDWWAKGELPPACSQDDGWTCPVRYLHEDKVETAEDFALDTLAETYTELSETIKKLTAQRDRARDQMIAHGGGVTENYKVNVYEQAGPSRWDEETLVQRYGQDVMTCKVPGKKGSRVKVTVKKGNDADTQPE